MYDYYIVITFIVTTYLATCLPSSSEFGMYYFMFLCLMAYQPL